ncbi:MAG: universal stress protein [Bacteroidota bacterium]
MIRRILVPVDFSEVSENALSYAEGLARHIDATALKVVHIFTPQTTADAISIPPVNRLMEERQRVFDEFLAERQSDTGPDHQGEILIGFAAEEIIQLSPNYDLVVMGTTGDNDLLEQVFGSVSSSVAQKAECPVLLIPNGANFREFKNLIYASNNISLSRRAVLKLMDFNELFHAMVHFVHVIVDDKSDYLEERDRLFAPLLNNPNPEFQFNINELEAESLHDGLNQFIEEHPVDMAIMVTKQRGFWARLFHRSAAKELTFNTQIPLMVFHLED